MPLSARRVTKTKKFTSIELLATAQAVYDGGIACFDTSTGLVAKAAASTTMVPIGFFRETKTVASGGTVLVELFRELEAVWMANSGTNACDTAGVLVYLEDDFTVRKTDNSNANSVAGRAWKIDATRGVLVEFRQTAGDRLGGLDA